MSWDFNYILVNCNLLKKINYIPMVVGVSKYSEGNWFKLILSHSKYHHPTRLGLPLWLLHLTYLIRPSWNIPNINFLLVAVRLLVLELKYNCINPHIVVMSICEHPGNVDKNSWEGNYHLDCETLLRRSCHEIHFSSFHSSKMLRSL